MLLETRRATASLQRRLDELETLTRLGRTITGSLDLDAVLSAIVDAAVELTGAEEGSLLLLDEDTGELVHARRRATSRKISCAPSACPSRIPWPAPVMRSGRTDAAG